MNEAGLSNNNQRIMLALQLVSMKQPAPPVRKRRMLITHSECVNFGDSENICTNGGRQKVEGPFTESVLQTHLPREKCYQKKEKWNKCTHQQFKGNYTNSSHRMAVSVVHHGSGTTATFYPILFPCFFGGGIFVLFCFVFKMQGEMQFPNYVV